MTYCVIVGVLASGYRIKNSSSGGTLYIVSRSPAVSWYFSRYHKTMYVYICSQIQPIASTARIRLGGLSQRSCPAAVEVEAPGYKHGGKRAPRQTQGRAATTIYEPTSLLLSDSGF